MTPEWPVWATVAVRALGVTLVLYACLVAYAYFLSDRVIFQPHAPSRHRADLVRIPVGPRDTLAALYLPNPAAEHTVLFSHGNAEDLGDLVPFLEELRETGFSVLAYDYRGYGASTGAATERNAYADIAAAYIYLTREIEVEPQQVILHGRSLGGAVAVDLAAREPVGGLVLESTFLTAFQVVSARRFLPFDKFHTLSKLRRVRCPVLVIHGTQDEVIPFTHGERLFAAAPEPRDHLWVDGAGHNDLEHVAGRRYWDALRRFGESASPGRTR